MFENYFSYFSTEVYVVGAQKYCLNETILLSTQNTCLNLGDNCIQNFPLGGGGGILSVIRSEIFVLWRCTS